MPVAAIKKAVVKSAGVPHFGLFEPEHVSGFRRPVRSPTATNAPARRSTREWNRGSRRFVPRYFGSTDPAQLCVCSMRFLFSLQTCRIRSGLCVLVVQAPRRHHPAIKEGPDPLFVGNLKRPDDTGYGKLVSSGHQLLLSD